MLGPHVIAGGWPVALLERPGARPHDVHLLVVLRNGSGRVILGPEAIKLSAAHSAALLSPGSHGHLDVNGPEELVTVVLDDGALEKELETLTGASATEPLRFSPRVDLCDGAGLGLQRLIDLVIEGFDGNQHVLGSSRVLMRLVDGLATALLLGQPHNHTHRVLGRNAELDPHPLRLAEAHIDAHLSEPISIADVAHAARVSSRTLQAIFLQHRGCSPKTFLQQKRLEHAREFLTLPPPEATVARIALACGFSHLGRFSIEYKKHFAESPSETLRRGKRRSGGTER